MKTYILDNLTPADVKQLTKRPAVNLDEVFEVVKPVLKDIKINGITAVIEYAKKFDNFTGSVNDIKVTEKEFDEAEKLLDDNIKTAIKTAVDNITKFHLKQVNKGYSVETMQGVTCSREPRAIENVGLYIPGGTAVLPSTMLMLAIPARIAGCKRVVACTPAKDGKINLPLLYAARVCGVSDVYKIGGAQAIGLMAFGGETFEPVNKIFGPGNQYVTAAKMLVSIDPQGCAIDMPAGPSEVLVIADETAPPAFVAADLLSQAEHGADSQVVLVTASQPMAVKIQEEVNIQLDKLPRKEYAAKALDKSFILIVSNIDEAISFSNSYAPEHLIINFKNARDYKNKIINAGSVFIGEYSPESAGDYSSGTNHSLPTSGYAKSFGGVSVDSFIKSVTFQELTREGLQNISQSVQTLAEVEGLEAHKNAVKIRVSGYLTENK
jgi:histidinol dehydrogenase